GGFERAGVRRCARRSCRDRHPSRRQSHHSAERVPAIELGRCSDLSILDVLAASMRSLACPNAAAGQAPAVSESTPKAKEATRAVNRSDFMTNLLVGDLM